MKEKNAKQKNQPATSDTVFAKTDERLLDFCFDEKVARVFDNMVDRSVPYYSEIQRMTCELVADFAQKGTNIYDLGCSTGTTFEQLHALVTHDVSFIGYDNSPDMLDQARAKLNTIENERSIQLLEADIQQGVMIENASAVMLILTLQFVRPLYRERLIKKIYDGMNKNGALLIVEKLTSSHTLLNRLFIEHYYDYKRRQGYSDIEIDRKREALENIMIPYRMEENVQLLQEAGFRHVENYFRWYNFSALIAVK